MQIEEVRECKEAVERVIGNLLTQFYRETGVTSLNSAIGPVEDEDGNISYEFEIIAEV